MLFTLQIIFNESASITQLYVIMFSVFSRMQLSAQNIIARQVVHTFNKRAFMVNAGQKIYQSTCFSCKPTQKSFVSQHNPRFIHLSEKTSDANKVTIYFTDRHGEKLKAEATVGDSLLDVIIDNDFNFETYGVCEGTISCSTCHVILDEKTYSVLEDPLMDEMDMLDLACGLTETSRLGCQVYVTKEMDGVTVKLPEEITDARDL